MSRNKRGPSGKVDQKPGVTPVSTAAGKAINTSARASVSASRNPAPNTSRRVSASASPRTATNTNNASPVLSRFWPLPSLLLGALALFLASRFAIIFLYDAYLTDVHFYHEIASLAVERGQLAYRDFLYGYPPLSLLLIYIPRHLATSFESYRLIFQLLSFAIDTATVFYLLLILRGRLQLTDKATVCGLLTYSVLGLFQGHIIYDRVDMFLLLCFVAAIYHISEANVWRSTLWGTLGVAWKVMPALWLPVVGLIKACQLGARALVKFIALALLPTYIFLAGYDSYISGHLYRTLAIHEQRGIQVESLWATPFMLKKAFAPESQITVANNFGAQHLDGADVPAPVVVTSKFFGFLVLIWFFITFARHLVRFRRTDKSKNPHELTLLGFFGLSMTLILFLASQRVLSTTYICWLLPVFAIWMAWRPRLCDALLALSIFALTYVGFDIGYWKFVAFDQSYVIAVALRNGLLLTLAVRFFWLYQQFAEQSMERK